ncbi:TPA: hypothetical protein NID63_001985 [Pseudomonas aeruginosa]|uniref:GENERAL CONTROL PROTEIN GCN4, NOR1 BINDING PROTEIN, ALPHA/BETA COILED.6A n=1 Tax=Siphoviridae sp. ctnLs3 TaxID=2827937 RepID=A0A8S5TD62_9CAUD|nr:hypothetical protein [Pseudomonas aeruginosa]DAF61206.1 MAG TPA: GENERAL CONTROL PROTEIN GCN4, NOR1 BINDING PROTEIN, ALPHA/BETA COILED.6A [Siphoviridae sp. ctnLs3]EIU3463815.1 hypothetical protein [Pseudomonas aeruginosa]EIU3787344.1 hypothetical protein [Pseudomonas aeruginosa]EIU4990739.1 hypothetical protein [Pseudomonas aeruginosa]EIY2604770.1 hypothetical protein [Pseudomonas aeruginosa]
MAEKKLRSVPFTGSDIEDFGSNTGGGNPPGGSDLERRVKTLEEALPVIREKLVRLETVLDGVEKSMATKAELEVLKGYISTEMHKSLNDQTWRVIGSCVVLASLAFTAAKFIS